MVKLTKDERKTIIKGGDEAKKIIHKKLLFNPEESDYIIDYLDWEDQHEDIRVGGQSLFADMTIPPSNRQDKDFKILTEFSITDPIQKPNTKNIWYYDTRIRDNLYNFINLLFPMPLGRGEVSRRRIVKFMSEAKEDTEWGKYILPLIKKFIYPNPNAPPIDRWRGLGNGLIEIYNTDDLNTLTIKQLVELINKLLPIYKIMDEKKIFTNVDDIDTLIGKSIDKKDTYKSLFTITGKVDGKDVSKMGGKDYVSSWLNFLKYGKYKKLIYNPNTTWFLMGIGFVYKDQPLSESMLDTLNTDNMILWDKLANFVRQGRVVRRRSLSNYDKWGNQDADFQYDEINIMKQVNRKDKGVVSIHIPKRYMFPLRNIYNIIPLKLGGNQKIKDALEEKEDTIRESHKEIKDKMNPKMSVKELKEYIKKHKLNTKKVWGDKTIMLTFSKKQMIKAFNDWHPQYVEGYVWKGKIDLPSNIKEKVVPQLKRADYKMKVPELKAFIKSEGLKIKLTQKKAELIKELIALDKFITKEQDEKMKQQKKPTPMGSFNVKNIKVIKVAPPKKIITQVGINKPVISNLSEKNKMSLLGTTDEGEAKKKITLKGYKKGKVKQIGDKVPLTNKLLQKEFKSAAVKQSKNIIRIQIKNKGQFVSFIYGFLGEGKELVKNLRLLDDDEFAELIIQLEDYYLNSEDASEKYEDDIPEDIDILTKMYKLANTYTNITFDFPEYNYQDWLEGKGNWVKGIVDYIIENNMLSGAELKAYE